MNTLDSWIDTVTKALGLDAEVDRDLILNVAADVAHGVARPAAPLTTFLVGLAAGRAGGSAEDVRAVAEKVVALVQGYSPTGD